VARLFDDASQELLYNLSAPVTGQPLTLAAWINPDDIVSADSKVILSLADTVSENNRYIIYLSSDDLRFYAQNAAGSDQANYLNVLTADTWQHVAATDNGTNIQIYHNGSAGTQDTSRAPDSIDAVSIGGQKAASESRWHSGGIAEAAIWNVALTTDEIAVLAEGVSPLLVRPESLVAYWPLLGNDRDWFGRYNMLSINGPSWTVGPPSVIDTRHRLWPYSNMVRGLNP